MMNKFSKRNQGFTLIELLVVVALLAALVGISVPIMLRALDRSKGVQTRELMNAIQEAADGYHQDHGVFFLGDLTLGSSSTAEIAPDIRHLTCSNEDTPLTDASVSSHSATEGISLYFQTLLGEDERADDSNTGKVYLGVKDAKNNKYGITRNAAGEFLGIVDSWGCGMTVYLDIDENGEVAINATGDGDFSALGDLNERTIRNAERLNLISWGQDKKKGSGGTDDIKSW